MVATVFVIAIMMVVVFSVVVASNPLEQIGQMLLTGDYPNPDLPVFWYTDNSWMST